MTVEQETNMSALVPVLDDMLLLHADAVHSLIPLQYIGACYK
jgi:hypothetical protein